MKGDSHMTELGAEKLHTWEPVEIERFRETILAVTESVTRMQEPFARLAESMEEPLARFTRFAESMAEPFARWAESMEKVLAPLAEEHRVAQVILELGFIPHAELFKLFANVDKPSDVRVGEISQQLALDFWPKVRPRLELSLGDCLGDQKIFCSFNEIVRAHDSGLYQLTTPGAASVIERAARLAQRHWSKTEKPSQWLEADLCELPCTHVRGWRALSVLIEQTFMDCWNDAEADAIPYPNRHAAAHGFGARISSVVDSLNAVLAAHFVITAAAAFEEYIADSDGGAINKDARSHGDPAPRLNHAPPAGIGRPLAVCRSASGPKAMDGG
jgi:hypothetical protein